MIYESESGEFKKFLFVRFAHPSQCEKIGLQPISNRDGARKKTVKTSLGLVLEKGEGEMRNAIHYANDAFESYNSTMCEHNADLS